MSNRYYRSENCAETINKEFSMAETFWPIKTNNNGINTFSCENDLKFENELLDYPIRDAGEKCGEIFILNCSGDVIYTCQFCEDYFINIGKLIYHFYDQHGFKNNRPKEVLNEILNKNKIKTTFDSKNEFQKTQHQEGEIIEGNRISNHQNTNENIVNNLNQINKIQTELNLDKENGIPKLIQGPGGEKYVLVSNPVMDNSFSTQQQSQSMHFQQQPTQQTFGVVNPQYTNNFTQIPQNQNAFSYNSPLHTGVQTTFINTPPHHNIHNNIVGVARSSERIPEENVQITNFDNLIEFDGGSNSNHQSPLNPLHKNIGHTIEEIVANYPDEDNVLPPSSTEQFVIATEETSNQCAAQTYQDHDNDNSDIISGNKIEALIEELVNSNSNSQQNYLSSENDNNQSSIVLSGGNHHQQQTLYVQNPGFFDTNGQNNSDPNLVNQQHIITHHQGQSVLLNSNEDVQQNYIFDGQHLPTNFVNSSNNQNQSSNLYIKFNENDGNIYLLNGFNNNLNINGIIDSNNQIQMSAQNSDTGNETIITDGVNISEDQDGRKITVSANNASTSCEPIMHNFLNNSSTNVQKLLHNNSANINNKNFTTCGNDQMITTENHSNNNNIHVQHVSAEEIVAGPSMHTTIHEQQTGGVTQSDNDINMQTSDGNSRHLGPTACMDIIESDSVLALNPIRITNIHKNQDDKQQPKDLFSMKKNSEPKFLDNYQKFLENKMEEKLTVANQEEKVEENERNKEAMAIEEKRNAEKISSEENHYNAINKIKNKTCKICGRVFKEEYHLKLHNHRSPPIKCEECNILFCSAKLHNSHKKTHTTGDAPVIKCDLCSLTFRSQHFLEMHMKNHNDGRPFKCNICQTTFRFQRYLDLHMNRHLGKKPYECNFCEKTFFTGTERSQHELYHLGKGCTYKCKECDKEFAQRSNLVNHTKTHSYGKLTSATSPKQSSTTNSSSSNSSSSSSNINSSNIYSSSSSSGSSESKNSTTIQSQCEICKLSFNTIQLLQEHQNTIHNTLILENIPNNANNSINNVNKIVNENNDLMKLSDSNSSINCNSNNNNVSNGSNLNLTNCNNNNNSSENPTTTTTTTATATATTTTTTSTNNVTIYLNCQYCESKFNNNDLLDQHLNYCHSNSINNIIIANNNSNYSNNINNKCRKCNLILRDSNELINHINRRCCVEEEIDVVL